MRKTTFLAAGLATAFGLLGLGCSHNGAGPAEPNTVTGQAATTRIGIDSTGNAAPGTTTGSPPMPAANPALPPGASQQPVGGAPGGQQMPTQGNPTGPVNTTPSNGGGAGAGGGGAGK